MEKLKIDVAVVNGCLGTVGSALVRKLIEHGVKTYAVVYPGAPYEGVVHPDATIIQCDMRELDKLPAMIGETADAYFHLAWMGTIGPNRDNMLLQTENIRCAVEAVAVAKQMGCQVFVGTGSQAECGRIEGLVQQDSPCNPTNGYGIAKLCAGQMTRIECRKQGLRHVWGRILSAYGPNDGPLSLFPSMMEKLLQGEKPILTAGEQMWDFLYADDVAEALFCMASSGKDGSTYPIGSGEARPLRDYFYILRDAVDPALPLGIGEMPYVPNQVMHLQADITPLQNDTGFAPSVPFEKGIQITLECYKKARESNKR